MGKRWRPSGPLCLNFKPRYFNAPEWYCTQPQGHSGYHGQNREGMWTDGVAPTEPGYKPPWSLLRPNAPEFTRHAAE